MNFDIPKWCKVGYYIDAKDNVNEWCVAEVKDISKTSITVIINEWAPKWESSYPIKSPKIAPFRKISKGYTGNKIRTTKTQPFSIETLNLYQGQVKSHLASSLFCEDAFITTQFYRGKLFMYIDQLLSTTPPSEYFSQIFEFLSEVIQLILQYFKELPSLFSFYYQGLAQNELYLEDNNVALASVWYELIEMLKKLVSLENKSCELYSYIDSLIENRNYLLTISKRSKWAASLTKFFIDKNGFDILLATISCDDSKFRIPFPLINHLPLYEILDLIEGTLSISYKSKLHSNILKRVEDISDSELKDLKHEEALLCLKKLQKNQLDSAGKTETTALGLFLKMLKSSYLEKRIKGLIEINNLIDSFEPKRLVHEKPNKQEFEDFKAWIVQENILELLLQDRPHIELIKRSGSIFKFLSKCLILTEKHLLDLWTSLQCKHQSYQRAAYEIIIEITYILTKSHHDFLYELFRSVELENYDESFLSLVKDFTVKAINKAIAEPDEFKTYGLEVFKYLILDSAPQEFRKLSLKNLVSIERETCCVEIKIELFQLVEELILKNESILQALVLFLKLMKSYHRLSVEEKVYKKIQNIFSLAGVIIVDLKSYLEDMCRFNEMDSQKNKNIKKNLTNRLSFLSLLSQNSEIELSQKNFEELWVMFSNKNYLAKSMFFDWMTSYISSRTPASSKNIHFIYTNLLLNDLNFSFKCNFIFEFICFIQCFMEYNRLQNRIELSDFRHIKYRKASKLKGFQKLVKIYLNTEEEQVQEKAGMFIFSLLNKYDRNIYQDAPDIIEAQLQYLLNIIIKSHTNDQLIHKTLMLLQVLFDKSDEETDLNFCLYVKKTGNREHVQVQINQFKTVRHFRKQVARHFKLPLSKIALSAGEKKLTASDDDMEINTLRQHWFELEVLDDQEITEFDLFESIQESEDLIKILFQLISNSSKVYTELAWKLLNYLPMCRSLKNEVSGLTRTLSELIDKSSAYKLIYCLKIVLKKSNKTQWVFNFRKIGGVQYIIDIFLEGKKSESLKIRVDKDYIILQILANVIENIDQPFDFTRGLFKSFKAVCKAVSRGESLENELKSLKCLKKLIKIVNCVDDNAITDYLKKYSIKKIIIYSLIDSNNLSFVEYTCELIKKIGYLCKCPSILFDECRALLEGAIQEASKTSGYWDLFTSLISESDYFDSEELVSLLFSKLNEHPSESTSCTKDEILSGILELLHSIYQKTNQITDDLSLDLLLNRCLCEIPESKNNTHSPPKCKNPKTRANGFKLLREMCLFDSSILNKVTKSLDSFHLDPSWRTYRKSDWLNSPTAKEKSFTGYVGLKNLGCTCYLNSIIQQLFMISSFRNAILSIETAPEEDSLLYQLQYIFSGLKSSDKQYISPKGFTKVFKDVEGNEINVVEQMDADEFFSSFMDKLETVLKDSKNKDLVKLHFGGLQVTEMIGKECPHTSERCEPFLSISVEVKNKRSLLEGLESYVEEEILEGENAYQCDQCEGKVKAARRVSVKHLPNILILALRRFEFDFDTMSREKLNDYFEFQPELNMEKFTQEGLDGDKEKHSSDYYLYRLKGIVIHSGTAENGHYFSYILSQNKWVEFNDVCVSFVNPQNLANDCFGGEEKFQYHPYVKAMSRERIGNAYMLIYERSVTYSVREKEGLQTVDLRVNEKTEDLKEVKRQNKKYWRSKVIFANEYISFINDLGKIESTDSKFLARFFLTILIRTKEKKKEMFEIYRRIESDIKASTQFANWFIDMISFESIVKEILLFNPFFIMRKLVVCLTREALLSASSEFKSIFLTNFIQNLRLARKKHTKHFSQYLELLKYSVLAESGYKTKAITAVVDYLNGKNSIDINPLPHFFEDIHLGYDLYSIPDKSIEEGLYPDSKGTSLGHLFELLYLSREKIPDFSCELMREGIFVNSMIQEADNRQSAVNLGKLLGFLFSKNPARTNEVTTKLLEHLKAGEIAYKIKVIRIFQYFLAYENENFNEKISFFLESFLSTIISCKTVTEIESYIGFLHKLCWKNQKITDLLNQNQDIITFIEKWLRSNMYILQSVRSEMYSDDFSKISAPKMIQQKIENIKKKTVYLPYDSDEEINEKCLNVESKISFWTDGSWNKGQIIAKAGDIVLISYICQDEEQRELKDLKSEEVSQYFTKS